MKTRIISMVLVVVTLVLSLAGCAYNYEKADMTDYIDFNVEEFRKALEALEIEDADFGTDEAKRQEKVTDAIIKALAALDSVTEGETFGKIGANDVVYYCFYVTGKDKDDAEHKIYASSMIQSASSNSKVQLGLFSNEGRDKAIEGVLAGLEIAEDKKFTVRATDDAAKAGDIAIVTYTVKGDTTNNDPDDDSDVKYTNDIITLTAKPEGATDAANLAEYLVGVKPNEEKKDVTVGGKTYSSIKITQAISACTALEAKYKIDEELKDVQTVVGSAKATFAEGTELTVHVYPVKFDKVIAYDSEAYNAKLILAELLGTGMDVGLLKGEVSNGIETEEDVEGTLPIFTDNGFKNGDRYMHALAKELKTALTDKSSAKTALEEAEDDLEEAETAAKENDTEANKQAVTTAQNDVNTKKGELEEAERAAERALNAVLGCTKGGKTAEEAIVTQYREYRYETLETAYENSIIQSLAEAVFAAATSEKVMTFKELPKKAVKEAKDRILNNYEYDFYEGTVDGGTTTNYDASLGNLNTFLLTELELTDEVSAEASKKEIKAAIDEAITEKAEAAVKDTMKVYAFKYLCEQVFTEADFEVTKDDVDAFKNTYHYLLLQYQLGSKVDESYYMPALQLDKVMDYLFEVNEDAEGNKVVFKNLPKDYSFKAEE